MACTCGCKSPLGELDPELDLFESAPEAPDDREWSDAELDYSIIISPTSPGDDRFRIGATQRQPSSLRHPFNTICFLEMLSGSRVFTGTGTLVAPNIVLTCKHNLADLSRSPRPRCSAASASGPLRTAVRVTPGADLSAANPANRRPAQPGNQSVGPGALRVHPTLDLGLILLPQPFRVPTKFLPIRALRRQALARQMTVAGFPCDKPMGTMWAHTEPVAVSGVSSDHLFYTMDTCPGHSGSPLWVKQGRTRALVGVHTTGAQTQAGSRCQNNAGLTRCVRSGATAPARPVAGNNCGVRITPAVVQWIRRVCVAARVRPPQEL